MIAGSGSFSYIRTDSKGKPYTIRVQFTAKPQSFEISAVEPTDVIAVMVIEVDEESGFQEIYNYYITENNGEFSIGRIKKQQYDVIKSDVLDELKERVLGNYKNMVMNDAHQE
jgi:hypothetical protein